jgi:hypothetical protein
MRQNDSLNQYPAFWPVNIPKYSHLLTKLFWSHSVWITKQECELISSAQYCAKESCLIEIAHFGWQHAYWISMNLTVRWHALASNLAKKSCWFRMSKNQANSNLRWWASLFSPPTSNLEIPTHLCLTKALGWKQRYNTFFPRVRAFQNLLKPWRQPF